MKIYKNAMINEEYCVKLLTLWSRGTNNKSLDGSISVHMWLKANYSDISKY
jgi:hypothetical protein